MLCLSSSLAPPSVFNSSVSLPFAFNNVGQELETYVGNECFLRFFLKAVVKQKWVRNYVTEQEVCVYNCSKEQIVKAPSKQTIGFKEDLSLEVEVEDTCLPLGKDILGKLTFNALKVELKSVMLELVRVETFYHGSFTSQSESVVLSSELSPNSNFRMPTNSARVTPSYSCINGKVKVEYFLNFVIEDIHKNQYFKKQPVVLRRTHL